MIPAAVGDTQHIPKPSPRAPLQSVRVVTKGKIPSDWSTFGAQTESTSGPQEEAGWRGGNEEKASNSYSSLLQKEE